MESGRVKEEWTMEVPAGGYIGFVYEGALHCIIAPERNDY